MRVLVACEYSGRVREAFKTQGHDVMSCDLLDTEIPGNHHRGDIKEVLYKNWDMIIAFPPCNDLAVSGARWFKEKQADGRQQASIEFFMMFANHPCEKIAIENPIGIMSSRWRKPDQIIQPWMFGHGETKATCIWLKGLPKLQPTKIVEGREQRIWRLPPTKDRAKIRSLTYQGIAEAMAEQWGKDA